MLTKKKSGVASDEGNGIIEKKYIKDFLSKPLWNPDTLTSPRYVIIGCDPNAGGGNELALVAIVNVCGQMIVSTTLFLI
jgi:hypothetical protein